LTLVIDIGIATVLRVEKRREVRGAAAAPPRLRLQTRQIIL